MERAHLDDRVATATGEGDERSKRFIGPVEEKIDTLRGRGAALVGKACLAVHCLRGGEGLGTSVSESGSSVREIATAGAQRGSKVSVVRVREGGSELVDTQLERTLLVRAHTLLRLRHGLLRPPRLIPRHRASWRSQHIRIIANTR